MINQTLTNNSAPWKKLLPELVCYITIQCPGTIAQKVKVREVCKRWQQALMSDLFSDWILNSVGITPRPNMSWPQVYISEIPRIIALDVSDSMDCRRRERASEVIKETLEEWKPNEIITDRGVRCIVFGNNCHSQLIFSSKKVRKFFAPKKWCVDEENGIRIGGGTDFGVLFPFIKDVAVTDLGARLLRVELIIISDFQSNEVLDAAGLLSAPNLKFRITCINVASTSSNTFIDSITKNIHCSQQPSITAEETFMENSVDTEEYSISAEDVEGAQLPWILEAEEAEEEILPQEPPKSRKRKREEEPAIVNNGSEMEEEPAILISTEGWEVRANKRRKMKDRLEK